MAVALIGAGAAGASAATGASTVAAAPRYYVQSGIASEVSPKARTVVRATATGKVAATVTCPLRSEQVAQFAATSDQNYVAVCRRFTPTGATPANLGTRIYRFHVTASGQVSGFTLIRGGVLKGLEAEELAVSASGAAVAVAVVPSGSPASILPKIMVISTRTGARAIWRNGPRVPGGLVLGVTDISLTGNGRELAFETLPRCVPASGAATCKPEGLEVRALSPATAGGLLSRSRVLVHHSALKGLYSGYVNDAYISPDGARVYVAVIHSGPRDTTVSVVEISAKTGKQVGVLYQRNTGEGMSYRFFSVNSDGHYPLLDVGTSSESVNGFIRHHQLIPLHPANGNTVWFEAW